MHLTRKKKRDYIGKDGDEEKHDIIAGLLQTIDEMKKEMNKQLKPVEYGGTCGPSIVGPPIMSLFHISTLHDLFDSKALLKRIRFVQWTSHGGMGGPVVPPLVYFVFVDALLWLGISSKNASLYWKEFYKDKDIQGPTHAYISSGKHKTPKHVPHLVAPLPLLPEMVNLLKKCESKEIKNNALKILTDLMKNVQKM